MPKQSLHLIQLVKHRKAELNKVGTACDLANSQCFRRFAGQQRMPKNVCKISG